MHADVELLRAACERDLGDPTRWFESTGHPNSLALCVLDAIYSPGARRATVDKVIARYRGYRAAQASDADTDGLGELLATIAELGGPDPWATQIGNRRPTSTAAGAPLRSVAVASVAHALVALGIRTAEELRAVAADQLGREQARVVWCAAPGQRSGFTWDYTLMLAQIPGTTAEQTVVGYVAREVSEISATRAAELVRDVADANGWNAVALEHAIWRFESGRPHQRAS
ncbi:heme peroxidase [Mycobacterium sp. 21AC1]|uniref:heme peroxidase n=1 Tax=[Mycobacterium] appelbergii TaxID=2939269 RepID=UPI002938E590|nr:heme peroxidase [Mycobacterium sp. 21AC1]MDV3124785.1 heme peroxidase [Mycobacterium sp. 21AC1]